MFLIFLVFSFFLGVAFTGRLIKNFSEELLDVPNQRSSHSRPVLRGGGLGFIFAFAISGLISNLAIKSDSLINLTNYGKIWLVLIPLVIVGFIDDLLDVSARTKYFIHLLAAIAAIFLFGTIPIPGLSSFGLIGSVVAVILSTIAITALINFYNFMDGLDGFLGSIVALQLGFIAFYLNQPIFFLLVAGIIGFLWWNWSPAKIFMGDVGSTVLGASVVIALLGSKAEISFAWAALSVTFPLIGDAIYTLIRRILNKENIFEPHRNHIYQRLHQSGWEHDQVAISYLLTTLICTCLICWLGILSLWINLLITIVFIAIAETYLKSQLIRNRLKSKSIRSRLESKSIRDSVSS